MNINDLCISKNAQFYKLKQNLSKVAVRKAFQNISESKIGKYLFNDVSTISFAIFMVANILNMNELP